MLHPLPKRLQVVGFIPFDTAKNTIVSDPLQGVKTAHFLLPKIHR